MSGCRQAARVELRYHIISLIIIITISSLQVVHITVTSNLQVVCFYVFVQSLGNDNVVDENNLSEGELELGEAVISINQYIMQPRFSGATHFDRNGSASSNAKPILNLNRFFSTS